MRVMIDTNILISVFIFRLSILNKVVKIASAPGNRLVLSTFVVDEARSVMARKWPGRTLDFEIYLALLDYDTVITPKTPDPGLFEIRDPKDYPVLYSALLDGSDVLVTGDKDFEDVEVGSVDIVTPAAFIEKFG